MGMTRQSQRGKPPEQGGYRRRDQLVIDAAQIKAEAAAREVAENVRPMELRKKHGGKRV